jgi:hypothetical protein
MKMMKFERITVDPKVCTGNLAHTNWGDKRSNAVINRYTQSL